MGAAKNWLIEQQRERQQLVDEMPQTVLNISSELESTFEKIESLENQIIALNSKAEKYKALISGFALGILASIIASGIW
ncbi:MAG: hypothetical protein ABTR07_02060 [Candidatus Competibacter denitrificans]